MLSSSPPNGFTSKPPSSNNHRPRHQHSNSNCKDSTPWAVSSPSESLEFRQSLQPDVDTAPSTATATAPEPEPLESQIPPEALGQLTMSSSSTPAKRVASGDGISEKKRARIEEFGEEWADLLDDSDDENEDTSTVAPANEEFLESIDNAIEGPEQTSDLDAKLLKVTKELHKLQEEVDHIRKEVKNRHKKVEVREALTKTSVQRVPQGTVQKGQSAANLNANANDDEDEDLWANPYVDDAGAYSGDASLYTAGVYFEHARTYAKLSKQLDSLDSLISDTIQPPCAMVVDTIQHFATKSGHSITDLEVLEKAFGPSDGWKKLVKSIGPWTGYIEAEVKFEEIGEAFMLEVARLAKDMKEPLEMTLFHLRTDLRRCTKPFHTRDELARYLEAALHNMEAEPGTLAEDYEAIVKDLLRMKETYRDIRKGFTKYKCLARSVREEVAAALKRARDSYDGDVAMLAGDARQAHIQGIIDQALDQNDLHSLNGDFDYAERWATVGAVMFYRQYQHLQTFIEQADRCDARARDLFHAFHPQASEEADGEEEAVLQSTQGLTEDNLRRAAEGRPDVTAEDEVPDGDLIDAVARAASHGEDLEEIEDDLEDLAE